MLTEFLNTRSIHVKTALTDAMAVNRSFDFCRALAVCISTLGFSDKIGKLRGVFQGVSI
jgi:hypothetical protein